MSVIENWSAFKNQKIRFSTLLLMIVIVVAFISMRSGEQKKSLDFAASLDEVAVTVDGTDLALRDVAFYVAYEEKVVEDEAYIYNPQDTGEYWNIHPNGTFIRGTAKQSALDMAVHDRIFYAMAEKEGITLEEEEEKRLSNSQYDFNSDLEDEQKEWLGVSEDELNESMRKLALAEKYQSIYAQIKNGSTEDYSVSGEAYQKMLEGHEVIVNEDVWDRVDFGHITVHHKAS